MKATENSIESSLPVTPKWVKWAKEAVASRDASDEVPERMSSSLTVREYYALHLMQALMTGGRTTLGFKKDFSECAEDAAKAADALISALSSKLSRQDFERVARAAHQYGDG